MDPQLISHSPTHQTVDILQETLAIGLPLTLTSRYPTHRSTSQSTANRRLTSGMGASMACSTITISTRAADGTLADATLAAVAVRLSRGREGSGQAGRRQRPEGGSDQANRRQREGEWSGNQIEIVKRSKNALSK